MKTESSIGFQKQFNGLTKITKAKTHQNAIRQFRAVQSLISLKKNTMLQQVGILPVRSALDSLKNITYTLQLPKYTTLKQYIHQNSEGIKQEMIKKIIATMIKIMKFLLVVVVNYVSISPSKILIVNDKVMFSMFALEEEQSIYDPEVSGKSLVNASLWSIAFIMDQLYRKHPLVGEFTQIPHLSNNRINTFLYQVLVKNRSFTLDQIQPFLNSSSTLFCSQHKQPIIKANLKERKLYCSKCIQYIYYNIELEQNNCRNKMDQFIETYKTIDNKFNTLIKLAKGEDLIDAKSLKKIIDQSSIQFMEEYKQHTNSLQLANLNPIEEKEQLNKLSEENQVYKDELVSKYQEKMKKEIIDVFKKYLEM